MTNNVDPDEMAYNEQWGSALLAKVSVLVYRDEREYNTLSMEATLSKNVCFLSEMGSVSFWKGVYSERKRICSPWEQTLFLLEQNPFQKGFDM